jgi:hypothetical protein
MHISLIVLGVVLVVAVLTDMVNTLVSTNTSNWKWWLSQRVSYVSYSMVRAVAVRLPEGRVRSGLLASFGPLLVLLLLVVWVCQQIVGFGLIWYGIGGIEGVETLRDGLYYSGVVFFTVGFGEVVPSSGGARLGALLEAFCGVLTTALVIGYLPALYAAFSEREQKLMTLDDGKEERITPGSLVMAWAPSADPADLVDRFGEWEEWTAQILETHTSFPLLRLFRSHHEGQNWVTGLGLLCDAALYCQIIEGADYRAPYWMLRRAIRLFSELVVGVDISAYRTQMDLLYEDPTLFREVYDALEAHGFPMVPFDEARNRTLELRRLFDARQEWLIDRTLAPRGFWGHTIGIPFEPSQVTAPNRSQSQP